MLLLLSCLWGASFLFIGIAVKSLSPLFVVFFRVSIAALFLWCFALLFRLHHTKNIKIWRMFLLLGLLNNVIPFLFIAWGQTQLASGLAAILNASTPIFSVLLAGIFFTDEKLTFLKLSGAIVGFLGVALMIGASLFNRHNDLFAQLAILAAAFSYSIAAIYAKQFKNEGISPITIATGQLTSSSLILLPVVLWFADLTAMFNTSANVWFALFSLATCSTAFAYILYFKILEQAGATNVLLVTLLAPIFAVVFGWLFLQETIGWVELFGMTIIGIGLSLIDGRIWKKKK